MISSVKFGRQHSFSKPQRPGDRGKIGLKSREFAGGSNSPTYTTVLTITSGASNNKPDYLLRILKKLRIASLKKQESGRTYFEKNLGRLHLQRTDNGTVTVACQNPHVVDRLRTFLDKLLDTNAFNIETDFRFS